MDGKNPGVKSKLLVSCFQSLFPQCDFEWKNSQGVFTSDDRCMAKRSMCYSTSPFSVHGEGSTIPEQYRSALTCRSCVWGLCGSDSTRANKANDSCFVLVNKTEKHFVAVGIASFDPDKNRLTLLDTNKGHVESLLEEMKKEKDDYCEEKYERKRARAAGGERPRVGRPAKVRRVTFSDNVTVNSNKKEEDLPAERVEPSEVTESVIAETVHDDFSHDTDCIDCGFFALSGREEEEKRLSPVPSPEEERIVSGLETLVADKDIWEQLGVNSSPIFKPLDGVFDPLDEGIDFYSSYSIVGSFSFSEFTH